MKKDIGEINLLDKSIEVLEKVSEEINNENYEQAISLYNSLLQSFEKLKDRNKVAEEQKTLMQKKIEKLEESHRKVISFFENSLYEDIITLINEDIINRYKDLKFYINNREIHEILGINIYGKYFKKFVKAGLMHNVNRNKVKEIQDYWQKHYNKKIDPSIHLAFEKITGKIEPRVIPQNIVNTGIVPLLNDKSKQKFYDDKNAYDLLFEDKATPENVLKRVNRQYFTGKAETISRTEAYKKLNQIKEDIIVKNSLADDGKGLEKLYFKKNAFFLNDRKMNLQDIEKQWGSNFIIQKCVKQHQLMATPHPNSLNTFRLVTLRWGNEIQYLTGFARFGANDAIKDNAGDGGVCVGVSEEGKFNSFAVDKEANLHEVHPSTGFKFSELEDIPNFNEFIDFVKELHKKVIHHRFISWDIAMGPEGSPIFVEMNFWGAIWLYQLATQRPILGEFTEEILEKSAMEQKKEENIKKEKESSENNSAKVSEEQSIS